MTQDIPPLVRLLCEDRRYKIDAYQFVRAGLGYAQEVLELGREGPAQEADPEASEDDPAEPPRKVRHVTGQDLSHALRQLALDQYGLMARLVLKSWGITSTSDFGEIVYNLIKIGEMTRSDSDRREDFDNVYDFAAAFASGYEFALPEK